MKNRRFFLTLRNLELQDYNKIHMLLSMTGFGKAVAETKNKKITVEIKSLNSKQLDLNARVPSIYRDKELDLRNIVGRPLERGKIDMSVTVESLGTETGTTLNVSALEAYKKQIQDASATLGIAVPDDWYSVLLRFPDTLKSDTQAEIDNEETEALFEELKRYDIRQFVRSGRVAVTKSPVEYLTLWLEEQDRRQSQMV